MRLRSSITSSEPRVVLALARAASLSASDAKLLLAAGERVWPLELDEAGCAAIEAALGPLGVALARVEVPPTGLRCSAHPRFTADASCASCGRAVCVFCAAGCEPCRARASRRATWKGRRVAVLSAVLVLLATVGWGQVRRRARRVEWRQPVVVSVTLHAAQPLGDEVRERWREGLAMLDEWFAAEAARHGAPLERPIHFVLAAPVEPGPEPQPPAPTGRWWDDLLAAREFKRSLEALAAKEGDVRLVVTLGANEAQGIVEGVADRGGELGLVHASRVDRELGLELTAVAHEVLHCLGAVDAYDDAGRAREPEGLAEPELEPRYPQRFAEVMAGEVPDARDRGHVPKRLEEVRIGEATARAIGWLRSP